MFDEHVKELSVRMSEEKDKDKEDEKLDLVVGELVKITNMLYSARGSFVRMTNQIK